MEEKSVNYEEEISLIDLFAVLVHYRFLIIGITFLAAIFSVLFCIISIKLPVEKSPLPNVFTSESSMLIQGDASASGLSGILASSGLGGFSSMLGVKGGGTSNSALAVYLATSNPLLDAVAQEFNIAERYKIKNHQIEMCRQVLKKSLKANFVTENGIFTVAFSSTDPVFAQSVVNFVVSWLESRFDELGLDKNKIQKENLEKNIKISYEEISHLESELKKLGARVDMGSSAWNTPSITLETTRLQMELKAQEQVYTQLKTQYELLKVQMQSEQPIFQILEKGEIPTVKSGPSRGKLCIIVVFAAFFISVFCAFALNAFNNLKNDPEVKNKFKK